MEMTVPGMANRVAANKMEGLSLVRCLDCGLLVKAKNSFRCFSTEKNLQRKDLRNKNIVCTLLNLRRIMAKR